MAIIQCAYGHYYDDKKNTSCPYCEKPISEDDAGEAKTVGFFENYEEFIPTQSIGEDIQEFEKTISVFSDDETGNSYTVGWLVSVKGLEIGKSYPLYSGRNFVSRAHEADIPLMEDGGISRDNHFSVVYDPKDIKFYLVSGNGQIYKNDVPIHSYSELADGDKISLGNSCFVFVPYCMKGRTW